MDVDKIAFTGSTDVGKLMMVYSGQSNMKRVSAECGGKSPQVVFEDVADFEQMVNYAVVGIYGNQGEVCSAGSRLIVHESLHERFVERFTQRARSCSSRATRSIRRQPWGRSSPGSSSPA